MKMSCCLLASGEPVGWVERRSEIGFRHNKHPQTGRLVGSHQGKSETQLPPEA